MTPPAWGVLAARARTRRGHAHIELREKLNAWRLRPAAAKSSKNGDTEVAGRRRGIARDVENVPKDELQRCAAAHGTEIQVNAHLSCRPFEKELGAPTCGFASCLDASLGSQLAALLSQSAAAGLANPTPAATPSDLANPSPATADATDTPPIIQINGNNPAIRPSRRHLQRPRRNHHRPASRPQPRHHDIRQRRADQPRPIDTTQAATDTIDYVVTDRPGLTSTSTRTVIIQPANDNTVATTTTTSDTGTATTTDATSTAQ